MKLAGATTKMGLHPSRRRKAKKAPKADNSWTWTLVALAISIASLAAIIVTAATRHKKPLPKSPLGITLDAAISVFATVMRVAILFCAVAVLSQSKWVWFHRRQHRLSDVEVYDPASRGPAQFPFRK